MAWDFFNPFTLQVKRERHAQPGRALPTAAVTDRGRRSSLSSPRVRIRLAANTRAAA